jgi:hypothetical protein
LQFHLSVSISNDLAQQQSIQDLGEVTAALSGLMGCLHTDPEASFNQPLEYWATWLDREGYSDSGLAAWFLELPETFTSEIDADQLQAFYSAGLAHGITTGEYLEALTQNAPHFVDAAQARIDALLEADDQAKQVAGGQGLDIRPGYYAAGVTAAALVVAWRKGYIKSAYNSAYKFGKKKLGELWSWATSKAEEARTDVADDLIRDREHPVDAVRQAEVIAPDVPTVALDLDRLDQATMPQIKAAAARYARKDIASMFSETKIANSSWYEESKGLIKDTVKIDKQTYNQLRGAHPGDHFNQTELAKRFASLDLKGIEQAYEPHMMDRMRNLPVNDSSLETIKSALQVQLQSSWEKVLYDEAAKAKQAATQDVIEAVKTESELRAKAYGECAEVRSAAVTQFNRDMKLAMEASMRAGGAFVDVEKQAIVDFEEGFEADIEV